MTMSKSVIVLREVFLFQSTAFCEEDPARKSMFHSLAGDAVHRGLIWVQGSHTCLQLHGLIGS